MEATQDDSEGDIRQSLTNRNTFLKYVVHNASMVSSLAASILGIAIGLIVKTHFTLTDTDKINISFPGEILLLLLETVTLPLIVTSVATGVYGLTASTSRKIAMRAAVYFILTTLMSLIIGLILVLTEKPGTTYTIDNVEAEEEKLFTLDSLLDLVRNMAPQNLLQTTFEQHKTERMEFETHTFDPNSSVETNSTEVQLVGRYVKGINTLGLIVCSFIFGFTLKRMGERGKLLSDFMIILNEATKHIVHMILCYLPVGVLFMTVSHVLDVHDWDTVYKLGKFMAVVVVGLIIHAGIVLPLVYLLWVRRNPWTVIMGVFPALLTAVFKSSSSATLPLTFRCCEQRNKIDHRVSSFMLPIGTNFNLDGTTLYEVVAAVFIAQFNGIHLDLGQTITIGVTAAVSCIGSAGLPVTGALTTLFILTAVGLPSKEAAILVVAEWLLDHFNTVINVLGDCIGVALVDQLSKKDLEEMEESESARIRTVNQDAVENNQDDFHSSSMVSLETV